MCMTPVAPSPPENNLVKLTDPLLKRCLCKYLWEEYITVTVVLPWCEAAVEIRWRDGGRHLWEFMRLEMCIFSPFFCIHEGFLYRLLHQANIELNHQHVMFGKCPLSLSQWNKTTAVKGSAAIICSLVIIAASASSHAVASGFFPLAPLKFYRRPKG